MKRKPIRIIKAGEIKEHYSQTVGEVSSTMPCTLKCTGKGGLAATAASQKLKEKLG